MTSKLLKASLDSICQSIIDKSDEIDSETEMEPGYELLLDFLIKNESDKGELIEYLKSIILSYRNTEKRQEKFLPGLAIAYCMHVLRWPEIYDFSAAENKDFYSKKMSSGMSEILDAYSDDWEDKDFYHRFHGRHATW